MISKLKTTQYFSVGKKNWEILFSVFSDTDIVRRSHRNADHKHGRMATQYMIGGTAISIYNGSANCVCRCYIPQGAAEMANWELKDLRYNPNTQKLYQLQEIIKICGE